MRPTLRPMKLGQARPCAAMVAVALLVLPLAGIAHGQATVEQAVVAKARSLEDRGLLDLAAQTWQQVLLSQPNNTEALAGLARAAKRQGKNAEAAQLVERLRQINPKDPEIAVIDSTVSSQAQNAGQAKAEALAAAHDYAGAMKVYRQIYGEHPRADVALEYYDTEAATEAGRDHAIAGLRELARLHPREASYQVTLGRVLSYSPKTRAEGETILQQWPQDSAAIAALRQALIWDAQNPASAGAIKHYLQAHPDQELAQHLQDAETKELQRPRGLAANSPEQAAYTALQANEVDRAQADFQQLLLKDPANPRVLAGMGFVHMKQGKFDQAVTDLEGAQKNGLKDRAVQSALDTSHFWLAMGEAGKAGEQNQIDVAAEHYRQALAMKPSSPEALAGLAGTLLRGHQYGEAALIYARWVRVQPNAVPAWRGLFVAQEQAGQTEQALTLSKRFPSAVTAALAADPEYLMDLSAAYRATGDDAKASQALERALNLPFPDDGGKMTVNLRLQYAAVLTAAGRYAPASGLYRQVIAEQPENSGAWQGLILAQHQMHDDAGAVETVEGMPRSAYEVAARDPGFLSMIAAAYQKQGRGEEAERLLQNAAAILVQQGSKPSADLQLQMASIEQQRNHPQAAAALYRRVLETDPLRAAAWSALLSTLHQSGDDAQALTEMASIPAQVQTELAGNDDYLLTLSAVYSATGHALWALSALSRLRARYIAQHTTPPADVEVQISWLLLRAGEDGDLYSTLMRLGGRSDLTDGQRKQVQTIWAAWSVRRAGQAAGEGNTREALMILNTAKDALGGNDDVSRALAGGYLTAGDAPGALAIFQSIALGSTADYQGAIGAALAAKNMKLAESWLRLALELYPRDPRILALAARFEQARGANGLAREYWQASLARSPDTDAADRLARTLRKPVAGTRGTLPSGEALAALLGSPSGSARRTNLLPGESERAPSMVAEVNPEPDPMASGHPVGKSERLGDYQAPAKSPLPLARGLQGEDAGTAAAPGLAPARVDGAAADHKRHLLIRKPDVSEPLSLAVPSNAPQPGDADERLQAAEEALAWAGKQTGPTLVVSPDKVSMQHADSGLTIRYATHSQENSPDLERVASQQELPPTAGATDQQLVEAHLPPLGRNYVPVQPSASLSSRQEAQQQIAAIDGGFSPWVGGTGVARHRSGTPGFDQLSALEAPFEASNPLGTAARLTVITTPVFLDGGVADGTSTLQFGSLPLGSIQPQQLADGVASELQITAINFAARAGQTPYGFLVTNVVGGVRWRPAGGPLTFVFSRESVKDTQLSYAGLRDPGSATSTFDGKIWGGVVANAGDVQVGRGDALSGFYAGIGGQYITGQHVLTNTRFHGNAGAYWRVLNLPDLGTLVLGANFFGMHYAHNLRYFTYGQGGYFSPEAYFLAAMPLSWTGHYGPDLHYNVTGSIGAQSFQEESEAYFPLDPGLQSHYGGSLVPVRSSVGSNYDLQTEIAYRVEDHWYVGGFVDFNNTRDYESQSGGFFVRYLFRPQPDSEPGPIGAFPRDGFRPVMVP